uniref:Uncharacterized protein n=1 Tax=Arundo donax TaxID=35708 RepID=A0A0A9EPB1_ARUDO
MLLAFARQVLETKLSVQHLKRCNHANLSCLFHLAVSWSFSLISCCLQVASTLTLLEA